MSGDRRRVDLNENNCLDHAFSALCDDIASALLTAPRSIGVVFGGALVAGGIILIATSI